ncbi:MAG: flippase-like domain-containing protein, partial [Thermoplasmatales archaeon]|nr:flippase-like domain-containing protein [Thermoplasmatales archaeon]
MARKIFKQAKKFLPLIGIAIFVYIVYNLDIEKIIVVFLSINPIFIICSLTLTIPRLIIRNTAWQIIQKEQKITISFFQSLKIFLIGYFYGSITPGYIGQLMRVPYMKEKTGAPYGKLFVNSLMETIIHTLSLYGMMLIGSLLVMGVLPELLYISGTWVVLLAIILFYFVKRERGEKLFRLLIQYLIPKELKTNLYRFVDTFYTDFPEIKKLLLPLILGIFTWIIIFSQEYIIVLALGIDIPYLYFLLLFPIANVVGFIPITFAGLGTRELTAIFLFSTLFGVVEEEVFVFTLLGFVITDIFTGFIGFILSL